MLWAIFDTTTLGTSLNHVTLTATVQLLLLGQQILHPPDLVSSSLLLVRPVPRVSPRESIIAPFPSPERNSPGPDPHGGLDPLGSHLMNDRVSLADDPHDLVPAALDRRAGRVHRVRQAGRLEQLLHLGDLLGHGQLARADL